MSLRICNVWSDGANWDDPYRMPHETGSIGIHWVFQ